MNRWLGLTFISAIMLFPLGSFPISAAQEFTNSTGTYLQDGYTVTLQTWANGTAYTPPLPPQPPSFVQLDENDYQVGYDLQYFEPMAYTLVESGNTISIINKGVSGVYDKNTCSISIFDADMENELSKESWTVHQAAWGSDDWSNISVNNAACETGFVNDSNTATIQAVKQNDDGIFVVTYVFDQYGVKTTVSYTNHDQSTFGGFFNGEIYGSPAKFGFVQSFADLQINVPIDDGFTVGGNDFTFDQDNNYEYLFLDSSRLLWGINNDGPNIYIDFKNVKSPTQYGSSQVIDPHITAHPNPPTNLDADQTEVLKIDLDWDAGATSATEEDGNLESDDRAAWENGQASGMELAERITGGNLIGKTATEISFYMYRSSGMTTEEFEAHIWNSAGVSQGSFGTITASSLPVGSSDTDFSSATKVTFTHSGSGVEIETNDIVGIVNNDAIPSGEWVSILQHDDATPDVYADGDRCNNLSCSSNGKDHKFQVGYSVDLDSATGYRVYESETTIGFVDVVWENADGGTISADGKTFTSSSAYPDNYVSTGSGTTCVVGDAVCSLEVDVGTVSSNQVHWFGFDTQQTPNNYSNPNHTFCSTDFLIWAEIGTGNNRYEAYENTSSSCAAPANTGSNSVANNDVIRIDVETNGTVKYYKNNSLFHTASNSYSSEDVLYIIGGTKGDTSTNNQIPSIEGGTIKFSPSTIETNTILVSDTGDTDTEYQVTQTVAVSSSSGSSVQSTGTSTSYEIYYGSSSDHRQFVGQQFNSGHVLADATVSEVSFDLQQTQALWDGITVYHLAHVDGNDAITLLEQVNLSYVETGTYTDYTFNNFTPFTVNAGDKIGIYSDGCHSGYCGSSYNVKVAYDGSDQVSNSNMYQIHSSSTGILGSGDLQYDIDYEKTITTYSNFDSGDIDEEFTYKVSALNVADVANSNHNWDSVTNLSAGTTSTPSGLGSDTWLGGTSYTQLDSASGELKLFPDTFTFSVWVYPTDLDGGSPAHNQAWLIPDSSAVRIEQVWTGGNDKIEIQVNDGSDNMACNGFHGFSNNNWYNVVWTFDGSTGEIYGYVNNSQIANCTNSSVGGTADQSGYKMIAGNTSEFFKGSWMETAIWNKVLSSSERSSLYASGNGVLANTIATSDLRAYWDGSDITATITNQATSETTYESDLSSSTSWTLKDDLAQPTNLTAQSGIPIVLDWDDVSNVVTYNIYRDDFTTPYATGVTSSTYSDSSASAGTTYEYKVAALGPTPANNLIGPLSSGVSGTGGVSPDPPTSLTATITDSTNSPLDVDLSWTTPGDLGTGTLSGYKIVRDSVVVHTTTGSGTTYTDTLSSTGTFSYTVRAVTDHGDSTDSNSASVTTVNPPSAISDLAATVMTDVRIDLAWSEPSSDNTITNYYIFRDSTNIQNTTSTSYSDTGLTSNTEYYYNVFSVSNVGTSANSNTETKTTYTTVSGSISTSTQLNGVALLIDPTLSISGTPTPTFTEIKIYDDGVYHSTQAMGNAGCGSVSDCVIYHFDDGEQHSIVITATDPTHWDTPTIESAAILATPEYEPTWDSNNVAYNVTRNTTTMELIVNRDIPVGWDLTCEYQTAAQAMTKTQGTQGIMNDGYYFENEGSSAITVSSGEHVYVSCTEDDDTVLVFTSYGPNVLQSGINLFNIHMEDYLGVESAAILFVVFAASLFGGRSAPTGILVVLALIGVLGFVGFMTIEEATWGIIMLCGVCGLFIGKRFL